ncbi:MAG: hypothetical protein BWY82_01611 [Verrucomicrobia bacterium ADurb.Bin474]|nr:MAG: hypothetical protein BWY82_01611 [Verrucomicrobia bacterium ADurb.Bin474]
MLIILIINNVRLRLTKIRCANDDAQSIVSGQQD